MNETQRQQVRTAVSLLRRHSSVDFNNDLQIRLAEEWFEDTLDSIVSRRPLPARPIMLMDTP